LQIRVFSSLTVSLSFPMISRSRCIRAQDHEIVGVGHDREPRLRCARFACVHAVATTPAQRLGVLIRSFTPQPYLPSPKGLSGRPDRPFLRGLLVHSRYGLHTRAVSMRDTHSEGFSYFATSIAAPAASDWSRCRVGLAPTGKRRLATTHTRKADANDAAKTTVIPQCIRPLAAT
jgi:hypothetical protein